MGRDRDLISACGEGDDQNLSVGGIWRGSLPTPIRSGGG